MIDDQLHVRIKEAFTRLSLFVGAHKRVRTCIRVKRSWAGAREKPREKVAPIRTKFHQSFIQKMFEHVLTADIDDKRHLRLERNNVGEILLRTNAQIYPARSNIFL